MPDAAATTDRRPATGEVEQRSAPTQTAPPTLDGRRLRGVIPYGVESRDLGGFREVMARGCLANADTADLVATVDHGGVPLARFPTTLEVEDRDDGLHWSLDLPESRADVREAVERGDLGATSWRMIVGRDRWQGEVRHVEQVAELRDVSLVTNPAYSAARAEYRSADQHHQTPSPESEEDNTNAATERQENENMPDTLSTEDRNAQPDQTETREGGSLQVEDRAQQAEQRSVEDRIGDALRDVRKGETRSLTTAASVSPGELSVTLFDRLRAASVVLGTGIKTLTTEADSVTYPTLSGDVVPAWYAEASAIAPTDPTFATLTAVPRKLAALTQFSNEVLDDSDPSIASVLNDHLLTTLALKLDAGLLEGTGTAPEIRGLKSIAGTQTIAAAANGQAPTLDNFADAIALLEAVNVPRERIRIVMAPRNVGTLRKLKASTAGSYLWSADPSSTSPASIFGVSVVASAQLATNETQGTSGAVANSAYVYDTQSLVYVQRSPIEIELDRSRLFNSDQSEMRAKLRGDLISPTPTGIVRVTGLLP